MAAVPTPEELTALFEQGLLAGEIAHRFELYDHLEEDKVAMRLTTLHNTGNIDLFRLVENNELQDLSNTDFFMAAHYYCRILLELDATPAKMMACVEALVTRGGEDLAANQPNATFRDWCRKHPKRAQEVIEGARQADNLSSRHLTFALEAVNAISEARKIALEYDDERRQHAITALGRINDNDQTSRVETLAVFEKLIDAGADDKLRANMLRTTAAILPHDAYLPHANALMSNLVEGAGDFTLHQAAHTLWDHRNELQSTMISTLLDALLHLNPANKATVNVLDRGLGGLFDLGHEEKAITFVTNLLSQAGDGLELKDLDNFCRKLVSSPDFHCRVAVEWLLRGTRRLCHGLANASDDGDMEGSPLDIRAEHLTISPFKQIFLCRKAVGWLFFKPITAASVLVSVLRICDADTAREIQDLLVNFLLPNYSCVRNYLKGLAPNDTAKDRVDQAVMTNETYLAAIGAIPSIKELHPSEHQRRIERLRMSSQMRNAQKRAESQSVLLNIFKRSVLLYGRNSVTFVKDGNDALRQVEMELKSYEVSFEMPRMEVVDPVGLDYALRLFRTERLTS